MCAAQVEEQISKLSGDDEFRAAYFEQWDQQRKSRAAMEEEEAVQSNAEPSPAKAKNAAPKLPVVEPAVKAQAVIAAALEAAATGAWADSEGEPDHHLYSSGGISVAAVGAVETVAPAVPAATPRTKKSKQAAYIAEPVVIPEDNFTLPDSVLKRSEGDPSKDKAAERERNRQLQAEAEAKKKKREEDKIKKKEKSAQQAGKREQEAAAKAAKAAAAAATAAKAAAAKAAVAAEKAAEEEDEEAPENMSIYQKGKMGAPLNVLKAGAPKPVAKRPVSYRTWYQALIDDLTDFKSIDNVVFAVVCLLLAFILFNYISG